MVAPTGRTRLYCSGACRQAAHRRRHARLRTTREVLGSSRSDDWPTDPGFFSVMNERYGPFDLDPCATAENAKCPRFYTREDDGLSRPWTGRVFCNPPYGRQIGAWVARAYEAAQGEAELVVCLLPARTDTSWWHDYATRGEVEFVRGRLRFGPLTNPAPFPSVVVVFRADPELRNAAGVTKGRAA